MPDTDPLADLKAAITEAEAAGKTRTAMRLKAAQSLNTNDLAPNGLPITTTHTERD